MLQDKYKDLLANGREAVKGFAAKEEGGKLRLSGTTTYQLEKDIFWDKIKGYANWENEVAADIRVERTDVFGVHTVKSGDTLSKIAKAYLGDGNKYMEIFNLNKDILTDPNKIQVGQQLKLPKS